MVDPGKQEGGGGRAAKGHSHLVLAKRRIERRIAELDARIEVLRREQERRVKERQTTPRVALIGYTNAGKSAWMNALTQRNVESKNQLFHTLGTKVGALGGAGPRMLACDTVGFLEGLQHDLLSAFHSTLSEAIDADLLLHVADASSPNLERQLRVTVATLTAIGANALPRWLILNKADLLTSEERVELAVAYPEALLVSAHDGRDRQEILQKVRRALLAR